MHEWRILNIDAERAARNLSEMSLFYYRGFNYDTFLAAASWDNTVRLWEPVLDMPPMKVIERDLGKD